MEKIIEYWWQFAIIAIVLTGCLYVVGKSAEGFLVLMKGILLTLAKEALSKTSSSRAASVNVIMLIISGILAVVLVTPNVLIQLGLKEENGYFTTVLGVAQFLLVGVGSGYFILRFEEQIPAFKDNSDRGVEKDEKKSSEKADKTKPKQDAKKKKNKIKK